MSKVSRPYGAHFRLTNNDLNEKENNINNEQNSYARGTRDGHGGRSMERTDALSVGFVVASDEVALLCSGLGGEPRIIASGPKQ